MSDEIIDDVGFTTNITIQQLGEEDKYGERDDIKIHEEIKNHLNQLKNSIVKEPDFGIRDISINDYECYVDYVTYDFPECEREIKKLLDELLKLNEDVSIKVKSWDDNNWECFGGFGSKKGYRCEYCEFSSDEEWEADKDMMVSDMVEETMRYYD